MAQAKKNVVTESLQKTVAEHKHIDNVYFDIQGNHHFQVYEFKATDKRQSGLNGLYARIDVKTVKNRGTGLQMDLTTPIQETKIVSQMTREEVLAAEPLSDLMNQGLGELSPEEKLAIQKLRSKE